MRLKIANLMALGLLAILLNPIQAWAETMSDNVGSQGMGAILDEVKTEEEYLAAIKACCEDTAFSGGKYAVKYCPNLVRGQGYYTGCVFEIASPLFSGAIGGGGRYDNLIGKFIGQQVPAVGFSIGFERICSILLDQKYQ